MPISLPDGPFSPAWESLESYQIPQWYRDAKFGLFLHWGVYAVPAFGNEWYPREMYREGTDAFRHHVATYGPHRQFGYKDFIDRFRAEKYDPDAWAQLFADAGARYIVPVAEHHDGFAMYESALTDWCASKKGPRRDLIGDLADAVRKRGMVFGVSSHRAEHWWFFDSGMAFDSDVREPEYAGLYGPARPEKEIPDEAFLEDWLARCCELVDKYRPQVFWFDWWIEQPVFRSYLRRFTAYYYNRAAQWGVGVAINYKHDAFPRRAAVYDIERGQLTDIRSPFWQTDTSVSKNSWGYIAHHDYKSADALIHDLVDIVSKNGCLLLNIGPRPDGTIPEPEEALLREIGRWLAVNGEAIYGARAWRVFGEGPTEVVGGSFNDVKRAAFTGRDLRFTAKDGALYAIALGWPDDNRVQIRSLGAELRLYQGEVEAVTLLGSGEALPFTREPGALGVQLPSRPSGEHAVVLKIVGKAPFVAPE